MVQKEVKCSDADTEAEDHSGKQLGLHFCQPFVEVREALVDIREAFADLCPKFSGFNPYIGLCSKIVDNGVVERFGNGLRLGLGYASRLQVLGDFECVDSERRGRNPLKTV